MLKRKIFGKIIKKIYILKIFLTACIKKILKKIKKKIIFIKI